MLVKVSWLKLGRKVQRQQLQNKKKDKLKKALKRPGSGENPKQLQGRQRLDCHQRSTKIQPWHRPERVKLVVAAEGRRDRPFQVCWLVVGSGWLRCSCPGEHNESGWGGRENKNKALDVQDSRTVPTIHTLNLKKKVKLLFVFAVFLPGKYVVKLKNANLPYIQLSRAVYKNRGGSTCIIYLCFDIHFNWISLETTVLWLFLLTSGHVFVWTTKFIKKNGSKGILLSFTVIPWLACKHQRDSEGGDFEPYSHNNLF